MKRFVLSLAGKTAWENISWLQNDRQLHRPDNDARTQTQLIKPVTNIGGKKNGIIVERLDSTLSKGPYRVYKPILLCLS